MDKKSGYETAFKLAIIKEHLDGGSITALALKWGLARSALRRWIDHYDQSGVEGLLRKPYQYHSLEFKYKVVESYLNEGLSLRECCSRFAIANESIILSWVRKYEQAGLDGLREQRGRPKLMKKDKAASKPGPPTRLEELEKENLYLKAENELLKKLAALTQAKEAQNKKR